MARGPIDYTDIDDGEHIMVNGNNWISVVGYNIYYFSIVNNEIQINVEINTYPNNPRQVLNLINTIRHNEF
jgi:hypothetical protein